MIPESFSVAELAEEWGIHRDTVLQMIHDGRLNGVRVGRTYRITPAAVEKFLAGQPKPEPVEVVELHETVKGISPATAARFRRRGPKAVSA